MREGIKVSEKEEIISGFKNAIERGESVEQAKQSFLNAGYPQQEVEQAAKAASQGASQFLQPSSSTNSQSFVQPLKKSKKKWIIILAIVFVLIIIATVGIIMFM